jgi:hypothetical protein
MVPGHCRFDLESAGRASCRLPQGGARQNAGRIEGWQCRFILGDEQWDLGAPENDCVAATRTQFFDYTLQIVPRTLLEATAHQLIEDDRVDPFPIVDRRYLIGDLSGRELFGIDRTFHQESRAENAEPLEPAARRKCRNFLGNVDPSRGDCSRTLSSAW